MEYVVFDLETTGLSPERDAIVEIGAMRVSGGRVIEDSAYQTLVRPLNEHGQLMRIPWHASRVHGISDKMVEKAPTLAEVLPEFLDYVGNSPVVAHNAGFDCGFMRAAAKRHGLKWTPRDELCTVQLSRRAFPSERGHRLELLAERFGLDFETGGRHRSLGDVRVTAHAFVRLMDRLAAGAR